MKNPRVRWGVLCAALLVPATLQLVSVSADAAVFTPSTTDSTSVPGDASLEVSGAAGPITDVTVTLNGLSHSNPSALDIELVAPSGDAVILMSDACSTAISNVSLTFSADATRRLGEPGCDSGVYRPTDYNRQIDSADVWPTAGPTTALGSLRNENPNGTWTVRMVDDDPLTADDGVLSGGFSLSITTAGFRALLPATGTAGQASPYPLRTGVENRDGVITGMRVTLRTTHSSVGDLSALLIAPNGRSVLLFRHPCGAGVPVTNAEWVFSDTAAAPLPSAAPSSSCGSGKYRPVGASGPSLSAPAPAAPYATTLSAFDGASPNGSWRLYVEDDATGGSGYLTEFSLDFTLSDKTAPRTKITKSPKTTHRHRAKFKFTSSEAGSQFQCRLDDRAWRSCPSPYRLKGLADGRHRLKVRAVDAAGNKDASPAVRKWRIVRNGVPLPGQG